MDCFITLSVRKKLKNLEQLGEVSQTSLLGSSKISNVSGKQIVMVNKNNCKCRGELSKISGV